MKSTVGLVIHSLSKIGWLCKMINVSDICE